MVDRRRVVLGLGRDRGDQLPDAQRAEAEYMRQPEAERRARESHPRRKQHQRNIAADNAQREAESQAAAAAHRRVAEQAVSDAARK
jgi:hypothetical protein